MTHFLLMRHGEADYVPPNRWNTRGWGADLATLTAHGIQQVKGAVVEIERWKPSLILSSPMTRALESALIIGNALCLPITVEFDLHEWVPDRSFSWQTLEEVLRYQEDFISCKGEWPDCEERPWEPVSSIRARVLPVFQKYINFEKVLVVCHGIVMYSLTGTWEISNAETYEYTLD